MAFRKRLARPRLAAWLLLPWLATLGTAAGAASISDPANDFIPSFVGTKNPSLDVINFSATFDGAKFHLAATENGPIASFATGLFVIGFDRGVGSSNFAAIGLPGVVFDAVVTLTSAGVLGGRDLVANAALNLAGVSRQIAGSGFTIDIPLAALPSLGLLPSQYGVNLWPRDSSVAAGTGQISDFAPNATMLVVGTIPEPAALALLATGVLGLGAARRRRSAGAAEA